MRPKLLSLASLLVGLAITQPAMAGVYVAPAPESYIDKVVGDQECVTLVKAAARTPFTSKWRMGPRVKGAKFKKGTAIATFDSHGKYTGHAALYMGQNKYGIQVIDQWAHRPPVMSPDGRKVIKPARPARLAGPRTIEWNGQNLVDQGNVYHVIN